MEHVPTTESDVQKVYRIAGELGIGLEDAAVTCDAFHLAFSDDRMRRAIFGMIDELDESAAKKGEPLGLIINYTVELDLEGIRVGRYADEIPAGEIVDLCPPHRARILLSIKDNFATHEFLGPLIVNRPELPSVSEPRSGGFSTGKSSWPEPTGLFDEGCRRRHDDFADSEINKLPSLAKEGCPVGRGGLTSSDTTQRELPTELPSHWPAIPICLGPIRLKFNERFPCVSATRLSSPRAGSQAGNPALQLKALKPPHHLPPWAAWQAGVPAFQSGLSPPRPSENLGHSERKMSLRH